ncbi:fumarylacetoacetate hydrolase [Cohnella xylanilytica]|uniref:fumarylacetoacetate hydrolase family protein n=1 Tax=Cohnella xylanilytica TaxID=557555 RepID=UPI001AFFC17F|nr:fumarylacetoacetate hydrolase family protein [Cohnella xylanilytica]GIO13636.1 fumarylacetoacetate hydrolase [Cohnella xylanilytica]
MTALSPQDIRNIYCVGRNYRLHAAELGNAVPESPMIFTKPTHALVPWQGEVGLPGSSGAVHYEAEIVLYVAEPFRPERPLDEQISHFTVGLDLTLRDVQDRLKAKGYPWLEAKGFRNSAAVGNWLPYPGLAELAAKDFSLLINGREAQRGNVKDMVFGFAELAAFIHSRYGLGAGDLIYTGTPAGVGALRSSDELVLQYGGQEVGRGTAVLRP